MTDIALIDEISKPNRPPPMTRDGSDAIDVTDLIPHGESLTVRGEGAR
jgi:hypothetical protein